MTGGERARGGREGGRGSEGRGEGGRESEGRGEGEGGEIPWLAANANGEQDTNTQIEEGEEEAGRELCI